LHFITDNFIVDKVTQTLAPRGTLAAVLITAGLDAVGLGLVMPILPTLVEQTGAAAEAVPLHVGVLIALYAVMQFFFAPLLGRLSDRFGRRRVLLASLAGATIDYLVLALTSTLWVFYLARAVAGVTGATNAVTATVIADITPQGQRAKRYGWLGACYGGGMVAGPVIGGLFGGASPHLPFLVASLLTATNFALALSRLRDTRPAPIGRPDDSAPPPAPARLRMIPGMTLLLMTFGLVQFIGQAPGSAWVLFTQQRLDWGPVGVGISLSAFGLVQVLVQAALTGRIVTRLGETKAVLVGIATDAAGLIGLAFVTDAWTMLPILAALGFGGITVPALQTALSQRASEQQQGRLQGALASLNSLTSIVGPLTFTAIFTLTRTSADGALWLCAAALYIPCAVSVAWAAKSRQRPR
jgi:DHA1 family tetracycline resistance protein-like MFS transporter